VLAGARALRSRTAPLVFGATHLACAGTLPEQGDTVTLHLRTATAEQSGTLRDAKGEVVCELPCTTRVRRAGHEVVEVRAENEGPNYIYLYSSTMDLRPGEEATAVVDRKHGHPGAAVPLVLGGVSALLTGALFMASACGRSSYFEELDQLQCDVGAGMILGGIPLVIAGVAFASSSSWPSLTVIRSRTPDRE
jgi:hypothetical protein